MLRHQSALLTDRLDQLAGVTGHEVGHVVLRHSVQQMNQMKKDEVSLVMLCTLTPRVSNGWRAGAHPRHSGVPRDPGACETAPARAERDGSPTVNESRENY